MTEQEWLKCDDPTKLLKWLQRSKRHQQSHRKLRLFACGCCRRIWHLLNDKADRVGVETAERYADGLASDSKMHRLWSKHNLLPPVSWALWVPSMTWLDITRPETMARTVAEWATGGVEDEDKDDDHPANVKKRAKEARGQAALLREIVGNPFKPIFLNPSWLTRTVKQLASTIYETRAFERMPILGDALEEAGCTVAEVLEHCRGGGEHVRGCWVVDKVLGKV